MSLPGKSMKIGGWTLTMSAIRATGDKVVMLVHGMPDDGSAAGNIKCTGIIKRRVTAVVVPDTLGYGRY